MSQPSSPNIPISSEQPHAACILETFWPLGGSNRSDEQREQQAIQILLEEQPSLSKPEAERVVSEVLDMEEAEYFIARKFCRELYKHILDIEESLEVIDVQSKTFLCSNTIDKKQVWSAISILLSSAGSICNIFNPQEAKGKKSDPQTAAKIARRDHRRRILQSLIPIPDDYMEQLKLLRNRQTHIDEYMDDALDDAKSNGKTLLDYEIGPLSSFNTHEFVILRCYDPSRKILHILSESYHLGRLEDTMMTLKMTLLANVFCRGGAYHFGWALAPGPDAW